MTIINFRKIYVTAFVVLVQINELFATRRPPAPKGGSGFQDDCVVGCVPIDDYSPLLFIMAISLGLWVINRRQNLKSV